MRPDAHRSAPPRLPRALLPVLKGLLLGSDGSVWTVLEDGDGERVERLRPERASVGPGAGALEIAAHEVRRLSPN